MPTDFGYIPPGSRCGNVPNELVHGVGLPFLDDHYRDYQWSVLSYGVHIMPVTWEGYCSEASTLSLTSLVGSRDTTSVAGEWLKANHILTSSTCIEPHTMASTSYGVLCDSSIGVLRTQPFQVN